MQRREESTLIAAAGRGGIGGATCRRQGRPVDPAGAIAHFAGDDACPITGQIISVSACLAMHG